MTCIGCAARLTARWTLSYAAINLDDADVQIREQKPQGLGRDQQQRTGKIIRLNDKTVTLQCDQTQWRVAYSFLHRVVDVDSAVHEVVVKLCMPYI